MTPSSKRSGPRLSILFVQTHYHIKVELRVPHSPSFFVHPPVVRRKVFNGPLKDYIINKRLAFLGFFSLSHTHTVQTFWWWLLGWLLMISKWVETLRVNTLPIHPVDLKEPRCDIGKGQWEAEIRCVTYKNREWRLTVKPGEKLNQEENSDWYWTNIIKHNHSEYRE